MILLENSYIVKKLKNKGSERNSTFRLKKFAKEYAQKTKSNLQRDILEGKIGQHFMEQSQLMEAITKMLCNMETTIGNIQMNLVDTSDDFLANELYGKKGIVSERLGDAYSISKCREIHEYDIIWSRKLNNTCYALYPVVLSQYKLRFLELISRRIFNTSLKIDCVEAKKPIYIRDFQGKFWKYSKTGTFRKTHLNRSRHGTAGFSLHRMTVIREELLHYEQPNQHATTLLRSVQAQQRNFEKLTDLTEQGNGDSVQGIFRGLGNIAETTIKGSEKIWHLLTKGVTDTLNDTIKIADTLWDDVTNFVVSPSGVMGTVLLLGEIAIIAYLWFERKWRDVSPKLPPKRYKQKILNRGELREKNKSM